MEKTRLAVAALSAMLSIPSVAAGPPAARLDLEPCQPPGVSREVRCGTFEVFENRAAASGRKIGLHVVVLPATGADRAPDPIAFFDGGPGQSAIAEAGNLGQLWADLNRKRDILLVDVRGTGDSNGLQCKALEGHPGVLGMLDGFMPVPGVKGCRAELEPRADLRLYTTPLIVDDVDDVRAALGYDKLNLTGASYGTFAALAYMRRHPEHVRTASLNGVMPPDTRLPLHFAKDAQIALDQVLDACDHDPACHAAFPDPRGDLKKALTALDKAPAQVSVRDTSTGKPIPFSFSRSAAAQSIRYMLYVPELAAEIPLQAHKAAGGDYSGLAHTAYVFGSLLGGVAEGMYLSVTCAEDVPFFTPEEAAHEAQSTFLDDFRARAQKAACAEWPRGEVPEGWNTPVRAETPTLLLSGERDPVTPAYWSEIALRTLPHGLRVVVPGGGHSLQGLEGGECLERIYADFLERGSEQGVDTSCVAKIKPLPFVLVDTHPVEVKLSTAELDRLVGTYAGNGGNQVVVRREGDVLQTVFGAEKPDLLVPVSATRFDIEGAPAGFYVDFVIEKGRATGLILQEGPNEREVLQRKP